MLMITLYAEQKKRHRFIEQSFRLCGRKQGWDVSREQLLMINNSLRLFFFNLGKSGVFYFFIFLLKDNCFTEFCFFLSNFNMNQP